MNDYRVVSDAFLEAGYRQAEEEARKNMEVARMSSAQMEAMQRNKDFIARRDAIGIDKAFSNAALYSGKMIRVLIHLLWLAEKHKIYAGFLEGEEYDSLIEWAEQRAKGQIEEELLARYCHAVQSMLLPISQTPPALPKELRIEQRCKQIASIDSRLRNGSEDAEDLQTERENLLQEVTAIETGQDERTEYLEVEDLLNNIGNTKTLKEMPYIYKMLEDAERPDLSDELVLAIYAGKSHTEVRKLADKLRDRLDEPSDSNKQIEIPARPVITMKMTDKGMELRGLVPDWLSDEIVAVLGSKVDFRFEE